MAVFYTWVRQLPLDSLSPITLILSILAGQANILHIVLDTAPPVFSRSSPLCTSLNLSVGVQCRT